MMLLPKSRVSIDSLTFSAASGDILISDSAASLVSISLQSLSSVSGSVRSAVLGCKLLTDVCCAGNSESVMT